MPADTAIIDFSNAKARQMFIGYVKHLDGPHRVSVRKVRANRSLPQNAWYWGCILPAVVSGLEEAWGETMSIEECHEWLKARFNAKTIVNRHTGEVVAKRPCSTADLDTKEFSEYVDRVIQFANKMLHVEVPQPT